MKSLGQNPTDAQLEEMILEVPDKLLMEFYTFFFIYLLILHFNKCSLQIQFFISFQFNHP